MSHLFVKIKDNSYKHISQIEFELPVFFAPKDSKSLHV